MRRPHHWHCAGTGYARHAFISGFRYSLCGRKAGSGDDRPGFTCMHCYGWLNRYDESLVLDVPLPQRQVARMHALKRQFSFKRSSSLKTKGSHHVAQ